MYLSLLTRLILVIGGLNYLLLATVKMDLFKFIKNSFARRVVFFIIGLTALWYFFNRDYYLPFLGHTVIPVGPKKNFEKTIQIKLTGLPANTNVLAWGTKEDNKVYDNPFDAYGDYSNSVVVKSDDKGECIVNLPCPSEYFVNKFGIRKQKLNRHIHYRYESPRYKGIYSRVYTKYIDSC